MKKILTILFATTIMMTMFNCSTTQYHHITKTEKDMYALEVSEAKWFWLYVPIILPFTQKNYIALCKAEANGSLVCEKGESSMTGFGAVN